MKWSYFCLEPSYSQSGLALHWYFAKCIYSIHEYHDQAVGLKYLQAFQITHFASSLIYVIEDLAGHLIMCSSFVPIGDRTTKIKRHDLY